MSNDHYQDLGDVYEAIDELPLSHICREMVLHALGDCKEKVILDIGGGTGLRARDAIASGATRVDNVDVSSAMLARCKKEEQSRGRQPGERIACYEADCFEALGHLSLPGANGDGLYDIVMAIWTFDHAGTIKDLEAGWRNIARFCRPGGKAISLGCKEPLNQGPPMFKYGIELTNLEAIDGGTKFTYCSKSSLPFSCDVVAIEAHYNVDQTRAIATKMGLSALEEVNPAEMEIVKRDREFWQNFLDTPACYVLVGSKK